MCTRAPKIYLHCRLCEKSWRFKLFLYWIKSQARTTTKNPQNLQNGYFGSWLAIEENLKTVSSVAIVSSGCNFFFHVEKTKTGSRLNLLCIIYGIHFWPFFHYICRMHLWQNLPLSNNVLRSASIVHFLNINIELDSEAERRKNNRNTLNLSSYHPLSLCLCLCPFTFSFELNFNISKVACSRYSECTSRNSSSLFNNNVFTHGILIRLKFELNIAEC